MKPEIILENREAFLVRHVALYFMLFLLLTAIMLVVYYQFDNTIRNLKFNQIEQHQLNLHKAAIERQIGTTVSMLSVFSGHYYSLLKNGMQDYEYLKEFEHEMMIYCKSFSNYSQFRVLGVEGTEKLRINCVNNQAELIPTEKLQDKSSREYFLRAKTLKPGEIYVSRLELNKENGVVEKPLQPTVRMIMALFNDDGQKNGYIVINIDARSFFRYDQQQQNSRISSQGGYIFVLTTQGTTFDVLPDIIKLHGKDGEQGYGFSFAEKYPTAWKKLLNSDTSSFYTDQGLINSVTYKPGMQKVREHEHDPGSELLHHLVENNERQWKIVSFVPLKQLIFGDDYFNQRILALSPIILLMYLLIAYFISVLQWYKKSLDRQLNENRTYLEMVTDNMMDGLVSVNEDGRVNQVNAMFYEQFGYPQHDRINKNIRQFLPEMNITRGFSGWLEGQREKGSIQRIELQAKRKNGELFPVEITISETPRQSKLSGVHFYILLIRDLSEINAAAKELKAMHLKYRQREKMAEVGGLVGGILHEVSNPMAAIQGLLLELADSRQENGEPLLNEAGRENVNLVLEHVDRLRAISYEVSTFLKPAANDKELLDLNGLVRSTHNLLKYDQRWEHMSIQLELDPQLPLLCGIGDQLIQVIINLMVNAADAYENITDREHVLIVKTEYDSGDYISLSFIDNAAGMSKEVVAKMFEQFYTTKEKSGGTGLGLSLCETIIEDHQGMIEVDSVPGCGTTIRILLPIEKQFREELLCES